MGVQADNMQIGQSGTNSQNFNIRTALDGVLRLSRGAKGAEINDPIKINADNSVSLIGDLAVGGNLLGGAMGVGQTWQDMIAGRALGNTYTNTSGKGITVIVSAISSIIAGLRATCGTEQLLFITADAGRQISAVFTVPAGTSYSVVASGGTITSLTWKEQR